MRNSKLLRPMLWVAFMLCGVFAFAQSTGFDPLTSSFEEFYQYYVVGGTLLLGQLMKTLGIKESADVTKILSIALTAFAIIMMIQAQGLGSVIPDGIVGILAALGLYSSGKKIAKSAQSTVSVIRTVATNIEAAKSQG